MHKEYVEEEIRKLESLLKEKNIFSELYKSKTLIDEIRMLVVSILNYKENNSSIEQRTFILKILLRIRYHSHQDDEILNSLIETIDKDILYNKLMALKVITAIIKRSFVGQDIILKINSVVYNFMVSMLSGIQKTLPSLNSELFFALSEVVAFFALFCNLPKNIDVNIPVDIMEGNIHQLEDFTLNTQKLFQIQQIKSTEMTDFIVFQTRLLVFLSSNCSLLKSSKSMYEIMKFLLMNISDELFDLKLETIETSVEIIINFRNLFENNIEEILISHLFITTENFDILIEIAYNIINIILLYRKYTPAIATQYYNLFFLILKKYKIGIKQKKLNPLRFIRLLSKNLELMSVYLNSYNENDRNLFCVILVEQFDRLVDYMNFLSENYKNNLSSINNEHQKEIETLFLITFQNLKITVNTLMLMNGIQPIHGALIYLAPSEINYYKNLMILIFRDYNLIRKHIESITQIFFYLSEELFRLVLKENIKEIVSLTNDNYDLFYIWKIFMNNEILSLSFTIMILIFLNNNLNQFPNHKFIIQAYNLLIESLFKVSKEREENIFPFIRGLFSLFITRDSEKIYYYEILKTLFIQMRENSHKIPKIIKYLHNQMPHLLSLINQLINIYPENTLFIELIIYLPVSDQILLEHLKHIIKSLILGLKGSLELKIITLKRLEELLDNIKEQFIDEKIEDDLYLLMETIENLMLNENLQITVARIFGKLKPFMKKYLDYAKLKTKYSSSLSYSNFLLTRNPNNLKHFINEDEYILLGDDIQIPMDEIFEGAKNNLSSYEIDTINNHSCYLSGPSNFRNFTKHYRSVDRKASSKIVLGALYLIMGFHCYNRHEIIQRAITCLQQISAENYSNYYMSSYLTSFDSIKSYFHSNKFIAQTKARNLKQLTFDLFLSIFQSLQYENLEQHGNEKTFQEMKDFLIHSYKIISVYKIIESFKLGGQKTAIHLDYSPLIDALVSGFAYTPFAGELITIMYQSMLELTGSMELIYKTHVFNDILYKFIKCCYFKSYRRRNVAFKGINFVLHNLDLGPVFINKYQENLLNAIYFFINNGTFTPKKEISELITFILRKSETQSNNQLEVLFIKGLSHPNIEIREISIFSLEYMCKIRGFTIADILLKHNSLIENEIFCYNFQHKTSKEITGIIEGADYVLRHNAFHNLYKKICVFIQMTSKLIQNPNESENSELICACYKFLNNAVNLITEKNSVIGIVSQFYNGILSRNNEISDFAKKTLKQYIFQNRPYFKETFIELSDNFIDMYLNNLPSEDSFFILNQILQVFIIPKSDLIIEKTSKLLENNQYIKNSLEILSLLTLPTIIIEKIVTFFLQIERKVMCSDRILNYLITIAEKNNPNVFLSFYSKIEMPESIEFLKLLIKSSSIKKYVMENMSIFKKQMILSAEKGVICPYGFIIFLQTMNSITEEIIPMILQLYKQLKENKRNLTEIESIIQKNINKFGSKDFDILYETNPEFIIENIETVDLSVIKNHHLNILKSINYCGCPQYDKTCVFLENIILENHHYKQIEIDYLTLLSHFIRIGHKSKSILPFLGESDVERIYNSNSHHRPFEEMITINPEYRNLLLNAIDINNIEIGNEIILSYLRKELMYKSQLFLVYPLIVSKLEINDEIAYECLDAIYRLFSTQNEIHLKAGMKLLKRICQEYFIENNNELNKEKDGNSEVYGDYKNVEYNEYNKIEGKVYNKIEGKVYNDQNKQSEKSPYYRNIISMIKSLYSVYFTKCCHTENQYFITQLKFFSIEMDFEYLKIDEHKSIKTSLLNSYMIEISKNHSCAYKKELFIKMYQSIMLSLDDQSVFNQQLSIKSCYQSDNNPSKAHSQSATHISNYEQSEVNVLNDQSPCRIPLHVQAKVLSKPVNINSSNIIPYNSYDVIFEQFDLLELIENISYQLNKSSEFKCINKLFEKLNRKISINENDKNLAIKILNFSIKHKNNRECQDRTANNEISHQKETNTKIGQEPNFETDNLIAHINQSILENRHKTPESSLKANNLIGSSNHSNLGNKDLNIETNDFKEQTKNLQKEMNNLKNETNWESIELSEKYKKFRIDILQTYIYFYLDNLKNHSIENLYEIFKFLLIIDNLEDHLLSVILNSVTSEFINENISLFMNCKVISIVKKLDILYKNTGENCLNYYLNYLLNSNFDIRENLIKENQENNLLFRMIMKGLKAEQEYLRNDFYDFVDRQLPRNQYSRLKSLLLIDWKYYKGSSAYPILKILTAGYQLGIKFPCLYEYEMQRPVKKLKCSVYLPERHKLGEDFLRERFNEILTIINRSRINDFWPDVLNMLFYDDELSKIILLKVLRGLMKNFTTNQRAVIISLMRKNETFPDYRIELAEFFGIDLFSFNRFGNFIDTSFYKIPDIYGTEIFDIDFHYAKIKRKALKRPTIQAIELQQTGNFIEAQKIYENQLKQGIDLEENESEIRIWEEEWTRCAMELQQWDILEQVALHKEERNKVCECMLRQADFKNFINKNNFRIINQGSSESYEKDFYENFISMDDLENMKTLETLFLKTIEKYNKQSQYNNLKSIEELQMVSEMIMTKASLRHQNPKEINEILSILRKQTPYGDNIMTWSKFFSFRYNLYNQIVNIQTDSKAFQEIPVIFNSYAQVLMSNHQYDTALAILSRIFQLSDIEIPQAFLKMKNDIKCLLKKGMSEEILDMINSTNFNFFNTSQIATLMSLKAESYNLLKNYPEANKAYALSLHIDPKIGENWYKWGFFLEKNINESLEFIENHHVIINSQHKNSDDNNEKNSDDNNEKNINDNDEKNSNDNNEKNINDNNEKNSDDNNKLNEKNNNKLNENQNSDNNHLNEKNNDDKIDNQIINYNNCLQENKNINNHENINEKDNHKRRIMNIFYAFIQSTIYLPNNKYHKAIIKVLKYLNEEYLTKIIQDCKNDLDINRYVFYLPKLVDIIEENTPSMILFNELFFLYPQESYLYIKNSNKSNEKGRGGKEIRDKILEKQRIEKPNDLFTIEKITSILLNQNKLTNEELLFDQINITLETALRVYIKEKTIEDTIIEIKKMTKLFFNTIIESNAKYLFMNDFYSQELELYQIINALLRWRQYIETICKCIPIIKRKNIPRIYNFEETINFYNLNVFNQINSSSFDTNSNFNTNSNYNTYSSYNTNFDHFNTNYNTNTDYSTNIKNFNTNIENYNTNIKNFNTNIKNSPEMIKIISLEPYSYTYWKPGRSRTFQIIGSDGKKYNYIFMKRDNDLIRHLSNIYDLFSKVKINLPLGTPFSNDSVLFNFDHYFNIEDILDGYGMSNFINSSINNSSINSSIENSSIDNNSINNSIDSSTYNTYIDNNSTYNSSINHTYIDNKDNKDNKDSNAMKGLSIEIYRTNNSVLSETNDTTLIIIKYLEILYKLSINKEIKMNLKMNVDVTYEIERRLNNEEDMIYKHSNSLNYLNLDILKQEPKIINIEFNINNNILLNSFLYMNYNISDNILKDFFTLTYNDIISYLTFIRKSISNYIVQSRFFNYIGIYDRKPFNIDFNIYKSTYNHLNINIMKKDLPMRLTPNIQGLYGIHLNGIGFKVDNEFKKLINNYYNDLSLLYEIGDLKKLNEEVEKECMDPKNLSKLKITWHPWF